MEEEGGGGLNGGGGGIDGSEGGLVWVQRRNGSWWPGRIMGLHEVSSNTCLVSPRSGTPVQLLGRNDASVDWYNLEKSKRVKAFRCGEYDEVIEKAKVSAANLNKKAVKYARREDAILHALELESAQLGKEALNFCYGQNKLGSKHGGSAEESTAVSHSGDDDKKVADELRDSEDNSNSAPELPQSGISFQEPNQNGSSKMHPMKTRRRTPNDSEDDGTKGVKRMRGLKDLGIGVAPKRKVQCADTPAIIQHDNGSLRNSNTGNCLANGTSVSSGKGHSSTLKRKRSQVANVHEILKRKNRRRQLAKVLESTTAMVPVQVICDQIPSSSSSPLCAVTDSKKSDPPAIHNLDSAGTACENGTNTVNIRDSGCEASQTSHMVKDNKVSGTPRLIRNGSSEKLFINVPSIKVIGEEKHDTGIIGHGMEKDSSKWQSKGKRNSRHTSKNIKEISRKYVDRYDGSRACLAGIENSNGFSPGGGQKVGSNVITAPNASYSCTSQAMCKPLDEGQQDGFWNLSKHIRGTTEMKPLSDGSLTPQRLLPSRQSRITENSRHQTVDSPGRNHCSDASLHDVKLEVKSSYRPQRVPLVSLVSKLDGKAFIGHPITVEVLDDGHYDRVLGGIGRNLEGGDTHCMVKPNSVTERVPSKNSCFSRSKSSKMKKSGFLNKKIRRLSSLTEHRRSQQVRKLVVGKLKGPVIACIPLKVVFSRINEAVSGQARPTHVLSTSNS
ncbi:hypothetical protein RIF29_28057 [Crotalaria pallida]|uniref:PWWP domain-containing protein n=1 Tax=Crotalaria pallida TaxID=3830 RepID=A0AAN9EXN2_CROPI